MTKVCAHYCGTTILLASFNTEEEADQFMKNGFMLLEDDEQEYEDGYWIYPDEMFKEEEIPFFEQDAGKGLNFTCIDTDELPF